MARQKGPHPGREYASEQFNLGLRYYQLPTGDRGANLQRSIECYTDALRFFTAEAAPSDYATILNNLGLAYKALPAGDRAANLERAIGCYTGALRFFTAEAAPAEYAATQNNLGNAYRALPTGDRAANLAKAIGCYALLATVGKAYAEEAARAIVECALELP